MQWKYKIHDSNNILGWVHPMHGKSGAYYCMFVNERDF